MILKTIRTSQIRSLFFPAVLLLTALWLSFLLPWKAYLFPEALNPLLPIDFTPDEQKFYQIAPERLYYTGCDALSKGQVSGHYYYSMTRERCQLYLLPRQKEDPAPILEHVTLKGVLREQQELLYQVTDSMAKELAWSQRRILELTCPYILDTVSESCLLNRILFLLLPSCILVACAGFLRLLFYIIFPRLHPRLRRIRRETRNPYILIDLEDELSGGRTGCMQSLYLTEHYLINLADANFLFQPLEQICWIYTHKYFPGPFRRFRRGRLYFTWWNRSGRHFDIPLPLESDGDALIDEIGARCPDILLRYSPQNKLEAEKILKKRILYV